MKFKSDFFLYSSHLKWMDQKVNEIINLVIKILSDTASIVTWLGFPPLICEGN